MRAGIPHTSRSSTILTYVPRLTKLPSSLLSCRVSRLVWMVVSAAAHFHHPITDGVGGEPHPFRGLMQRTSSA
jgi:hypothetical protein